MTIIEQSFQLPPTCLDSKHLAAQLVDYLELPGSVLLCSGGQSDAGRVHWAAFFPFETITLKGNEKDPWGRLKARLGSFSTSSPIPLWWGYLSYEMGCFADPEKPLKLRPNTLPLAHFQRSAIILELHRHEGEGRLYVDEAGFEQLSPHEKNLAEPLTHPEGIKALLNRSMRVPSACTGRIKYDDSETFSSYKGKVAYLLEAIGAGVIYQANLSHELLLEGDFNARGIFTALAKRNPAPFSAYFDLGEQQLISSSPERLLCSRGGHLETRPIKGTLPRGKTAFQDDANRKELLASEKNAAELLMITDLMRNDLSRVSEPGSVKVPQLRRLEAYDNVFHLLSLVEGRLQQGVHPVDALRACFPGGSVTGCPKLRAMELIDVMEKRPRGPYTGSIGYFSANGDFDFNICIRTLYLQGRQLRFALGGAIVADSDPLEEWEETLHKGQSIFKTLGVQC